MNEEIEFIIDAAKEQMQNAIAHLIKELQSISSDSISIIEDYYFKNRTYDDVFNKTFLNKKSLNNDFLRNIIIMGDRNRTCIYFFNKNKIKNKIKI